MTVDEHESLPDLGEFVVPELHAARTAQRERTRAAVACITWHGDHQRAHRRDWVLGYMAAFIALAGLLVAILTVRESWACLVFATAVVPIVASAWRSGTKVNAERDHHAACGQCGVLA